MKKISLALKYAFPLSIPVLIGYLLLGTAYGILMDQAGYDAIWTFFSSLFMFAGSAQYLSIGFLATNAPLWYVFIIIFVVNARHLFYGIGMLKKYQLLGWKRWYLIFGLTDETFSIVSTHKIPETIDRGWFYFLLTLMNQFYWVASSVLGAILGNLIEFDTKGMDFVLTALFIVIFLGQWEQTKEHRPALIGLFGTSIALVFFGSTWFLVPAMFLIITLLFLSKPHLRYEAMEI